MKIDDFLNKHTIEIKKGDTWVKLDKLDLTYLYSIDEMEFYCNIIENSEDEGYILSLFDNIKVRYTSFFNPVVKCRIKGD